MLSVTDIQFPEQLSLPSHATQSGCRSGALTGGLGFDVFDAFGGGPDLGPGAEGLSERPAGVWGTDPR